MRRVGGWAGVTGGGVTGADEGFGDPADADEEDWGEEEAEESYADHAEEDGGAQGAAHFRACAFGDDQREHAEDEGEAGHQDGAEAEARGFDGGGDAVLALLLLLLGELYDQHGIFGA